ncbi:MAG: hypothetical protein NTY19_43240 [Planctomycetota bacterium]|nr:hypothetical protein [Planctomycetota bacterium]
MNPEQLQRMIHGKTAGELAKLVAADLDCPSPLIGADGPPDQPGPEEHYVRALPGASADVQQAFAEALRIILLEEAGVIAKTRRVGRPLLLYNTFSLLEAVKIPGIPELLQIFRAEELPLAAALADQHDDLYAQLLIAHAVNQYGSPQDLEFWLQLLEHEDVDYVNAGVVGLRESGPYNALRHLARIKAAHEQHPELGSFADEVMLLLDTYPDFNWLLGSGEFVLDLETKSLIERYDRERYKPELEELEGTAAASIVRAGKTDQVRRTRANWRAVPVRALVGAANGR